MSNTTLYFLGKIRKYFKMSICEIFTEHAVLMLLFSACLIRCSGKGVFCVLRLFLEMSFLPYGTCKVSSV